MQRLGTYYLTLAGFFLTLPAFAADPVSSGGAKIPHMDVTTFPSQLFWLTVCFGLLYFIMSRIALPQVQDILNRRQNTVQKNLEKAAKLRDEAEDLQIAYDKALRQADNHAQEFLNNSINDMTEKNSDELAKALDKILVKVQAAEDKIHQQRDKAIQEAEKIADDVANILTEKVLQIQKNDPNQKKKRA